ncbi:MAG: phosphoadenosine phosphosulfate reductase family protein [Firmicutes bacterium]|nr:phosphoadenosine phosphosulfate reductase family protein [Bacillota bacterium]
MRNKEMIIKKMEDSKKIVREAFAKYSIKDLSIAWTGGKDSTLVLEAIYQVCQEDGLPMPKCFCIDEGDMFKEVRDFITENEKKYGVQIEYIHNDDVSKAAGGKLGATVKISDLNKRNRAEIERLGYEEDEFDYEPESFVGNHLMKTATLNMYLEESKVKGFFEGIRWDEQGSRANETFFSPREKTEYNPEHMRLCPILHFTERDVWDAHFEYNIPICSLYKNGYRSLGARITTSKTTDVPAWEQDLENTDERGGRRQDKEGLMEKLRELGYM